MPSSSSSNISAYSADYVTCSSSLSRMQRRLKSLQPDLLEKFYTELFNESYKCLIGNVRIPGQLIDDDLLIGN